VNVISPLSPSWLLISLFYSWTVIEQISHIHMGVRCLNPRCAPMNEAGG
jgi:hypothetical protein